MRRQSEAGDYMVRSGSKATFEEGPVLADSVAKVPERSATKFPLNDKTGGDRRSL